MTPRHKAHKLATNRPPELAEKGVDENGITRLAFGVEPCYTVKTARRAQNEDAGGQPKAKDSTVLAAKSTGGSAATR